MKLSRVLGPLVAIMFVASFYMSYEPRGAAHDLANATNPPSRDRGANDAEDCGATAEHGAARVRSRGVHLALLDAAGANVRAATGRRRLWLWPAARAAGAAARARAAGAAARCAATLAPLAADACALAQQFKEGEVLLVAARGDALARDGARIAMAREAAGRSHLLVVAADDRAARLAERLGVAWWRPPLETAAPLASLQWSAAAALLRAGIAVVLGDASVVWRASPFAHLSRDADVEAAQRTGGRAQPRGSVVGVSDPPMGWSAYGQTMAVPEIDPAVAALQPTHEAAAVAAAMAAALRSPLDAAAVAEAFTRIVLQPSHDETQRAGASLRQLPSQCYLRSAPAVVKAGAGAAAAVCTVLDASAAAPAPTAEVEAAAAAVAAELPHAPPGEPRPTVSPSCLTGSECGPGPNAILTSLDVAAGRELVLRQAAPPT